MDLGVVPLNEGRIPAARENRAKLLQAELAVHLGISAARHVEVEMGRALVDDPQLQRAASAPRFHGLAESLQAGASRLLGKLGSLPARDLYDCLPRDFENGFAAEGRSQSIQNGRKNARFYFAAAQNANRIQLNIGAHALSFSLAESGTAAILASGLGLTFYSLLRPLGSHLYRVSVLL
jgi:hypothetical protein